MENSNAATDSTCSWATSTASGSRNPQQVRSPITPYQQQHHHNHQIMSTTSNWVTATSATRSASSSAASPSSSSSLSNTAAGFDSNNNSSSCTNNERESDSGSVGARKLPLSTVSVAQRVPTTNSRPVDIAQLARTIGNEFRGEFIVLPHHLVNFDHGDPVDLDNVMGGGGGAGGGADDEVSSNSEDCVYAYRGDQERNEMAGDVEEEDDDDETDFLEMDFDPEPNSEQENFPIRNGMDEVAVFQVANPLNLLDRSGDTLNEWRDLQNVGVVNQSPKPLELVEAGEEIEVANELEEYSREEVATNDPKSEGVLSDEKEGEELPIVDPIKVTGTKPKVKSVIPSSQSEEEKTQSLFKTAAIPIKHISHVPDPSASSSTSPSTSNCNAQKNEMYPVKSEEVSCLECSELELCTPSVLGSSKHCRKHCKKSRNSDSTIVTNKAGEDLKQIQICPNILDEENILSSFTMLGVELQRERLHEELKSNRMRLERTETITDYLINYTRANCDPRRFVKLIEKCCSKETFAELDFDFQSVSPEFNLLPVPAAELLSRWSSEQGLRDLARVDNKRFHRANVLGKVANLIRLLRKARDPDKVTASSLLVPTYYRPGIISISRRRSQPF